MSATRTHGQRYDDWSDRLTAAYAERHKHPLFSPAWDVADIAVARLFEELRVLNREVAS